MKLLHIDSSITGPNSVSRRLSAATVDRLKDAHPSLEVIYHDLVADPVPHLTGSHLAAAGGAATQDAVLQRDLELGATLLEEFLAADIVVVGVALYNFAIPSQLKTWIDRIVVRGKTFNYSEKGPIGLAGGKRVILNVAKGAIYAPGTALETFEHAESHLRATFGFIGITQLEVIVAEGVGSSTHRDASIQNALEHIARLAA